jgi:hypothetical protein
MLLAEARRPRIVHPRCLRCRNPLAPSVGHPGVGARCDQCDVDYDWLDMGEEDDA